MKFFPIEAKIRLVNMDVGEEPGMWCLGIEGSRTSQGWHGGQYAEKRS